MRKLLLLIATAILAMTPASSSLAQPRSYALSAGPVYTSEEGTSSDGAGKDGQGEPRFPRVDVIVRISASDGSPLAAKPSDLELFSGNGEVGRGVSARPFAETGYGMRAILALDASGSMSGAPLSAIRATIAKFVDQARPQDAVEVMSFADDTQVEVPFSAGKELLAERLRQVKSRGSQTHLYDGLLDAMAQLEAGEPLRKQLTVISDGHDEGSRHSIHDVIREALARHISIDSIGLTRSHPEFLRTLAHISQATGGRYAQAKSPQQLEGLIGQGIQAMRATPVTAFTLTGLNADGQTHPLELRWLPEGLSARVDVAAPGSSLPAGSRTRPLWLWALAACFAAGLILLFISRQRRDQQAPRQIEPRPVEMPPQEPPPIAAKAYRSSAAVIEEDAPFQPASLPLRDNAPATGGQVLPGQRAQTRFAAFFDPSQVKPMLEVIGGPLAGKSFPLTGDFRIGAVDGNDLVIQGDDTLSGFHARMLVSDSVLMIEDSSSTNGTFVNGVRLGLDRKLLQPGDEIRMGESAFRVRAR